MMSTFRLHYVLLLMLLLSGDTEGFVQQSTNSLSLGVARSRPYRPASSRRWSTALKMSGALYAPPPPPELKILPLPVILAGGLFLFNSSVKPRQRKFADDILAAAEVTLRADPTVSMELGQGIEAGGVFASASGGSTMSVAGGTSGTGEEEAEGGTEEIDTIEVEQLVLQFQINGGNAWAQGLAYGIRCTEGGAARLVSLDVANMDATLYGKPSAVAVPNLEKKWW